MQLLSDEAILLDILASQAEISFRYGLSADQCSSQKVRNEMLSLLNEEHRLHNAVMEELQKRAVIQSKPVNAEKLAQRKKQYEQIIDRI